MKRSILFAFSILIAYTGAMSQGGMWLPNMLQNNERDMQLKGCHISAKDIYDEKSASIKDAVMLFGTGCTGEFVSDKGLVFTNHHCGYYQIVRHSTVERDLLTNGFAAMDMSEELPCPGLTVTLLQYMKDVTNEVLQGVKSTMTETQRAETVEKNIKNIIDKITKGTNLTAQIKSLYYGNQYMMYVNKVYKDVRLVAAPPSNIGKFGGDTDNWMWPRHTGDFSVFRVYADENNEPKEYSKTNVPYKPKKHLKISMRDKKDGDFTFVVGYPGRTQQFLTSDAVSFVQDVEDPIRIGLRTQRLNVYKSAVEESPAQRLRYASTVANIANGWKKWQGEVKGLKQLKVLEKKQQVEKNNALIKKFSEVYAELRPYKIEEIYLSEAVLASDFLSNARRLLNLASMSIDTSMGDVVIGVEVGKILTSLNKYYDNDFAHHRSVDSTIFVSTMKIYYEDFGKDNFPFMHENVNDKGTVEEYLSGVFNKSMLSQPQKLNKILKNYKRKNYKKLLSDDALELLSPIWGHYTNVSYGNIVKCNSKLDSLYRIYVADILSKDISGQMRYPDANLTMRVTYGNIAPFKPKDGVEYASYTTVRGIMEKENPDVYDYKVEKKLKDIYLNNDYGIYGDKVCFIATNHTTGGNSGSGVMDAEGNLIGLNFDRNWEGTMSDIWYDKDLCRNISLDIRYLLLIMDKYLGAQNLIDELEFVK